MCGVDPHLLGWAVIWVSVSFILFGVAAVIRAFE